MHDESARPLKLALAVAVISAGAIIAYVSDSPGERTVAAFFAGLIALFLCTDFYSPRVKRSHAAAPILENEPAKLADHADFQPFIDSLVDPVLVLAGKKVARANEAARKLLGQHILGEDVRLVIRHPAAADLFAADDPKKRHRPIQLVGIGARDQRWELRLAELPGGESIIYLWDRSGVYAVERMRTDFVANASHELRTPLSSIKGFIETLEEDEAGDDPNTRARFLSVMMREATRMQKLIDDLISLSRIEAEKFRLPDTEVNLPDLVQEVQQVFRQSYGERGQDVQVDISEGLPRVNGDRAQLSQVLHNLVSNSAKYGRPGTPITVRVEPSRNRALVRLSVSDEGEGIAPEHLPRLTERFYRVDLGRSRAIGGTGLGLSIVKHVVERHRGRLEIDSTQGKGTTITVLLPVAAEAPASAPAQPRLAETGS